MTITHSLFPKITLAIVCGGICLLSLFLMAQRASAQFNVSGDTGAQIEVDPRYPGPDETVALRFTDYSQSTNGSGLSWYIGGVHNPAFNNQSVIKVRTPVKLGKPLTVEARLASTIGNERSAKTVLVPNQVDIITESTTFAPYFYKGRRVPSVGSFAHLVAVPHVFTTKGARVPVKDMVFSWTINNEIVKQARGDQSLDYTLSTIGDSMVTLVVESIDSATRFEKEFYIETTEPSLYFYEYYPLSGLSRNALQDNYLRATDEVTVRVEPYFMGADVYQNAQYGWVIDGTEIANQNNDPQMITLQKNGAGGTSDIGFSIRNLSALSQFATNLFRLEFE